MGVGISDLLVKKNIKMEDLSHRIIAIDAMNIIYQFVTTIRQLDGTPLKDSKGRITSHLSGLFYRTAKMLENNVKPVFVFDGKPPEFKLVSEQRAKRKEIAREKEKEARERGDMEEALKWSKQSVKITDEIINSSKELLTAMGVPWIQAPSEGEAQASYMCRTGKVWAVSSQDMDCLLFGTPRLVRNVAVASKRKMPGKMKWVEAPPEMIELDEVLKNSDLTRRQLIMLGLLVGTDFNPGGIERIGPKKALKYVKEHEDLSEVEWKWDMSPDQLIDFFENPPITDDYNMEWNKIDENELRRILLEEYDFSADRIESTLKKITGGESSLSKWTS